VFISDFLSVFKNLSFVSGSTGAGEILLILLVLLLLFGAKRLPSIAHSLGEISEKLRKSAQDFSDELTNAAHNDLNDSEMDKHPSSSDRKG